MKIERFSLECSPEVRNHCPFQANSSSCSRECFNGIDSESLLHSFTELKSNVVLTGKNGSGKSRLFKLIEESDNALRIADKSGNPIDLENSKIINFSCTDAQLQSIDKFPAYTIGQSSHHIEGLAIIETALNSLLYIEGLVKEYINGVCFSDFADYVNRLFSIVEENMQMQLREKKAFFFGREVSGDEISPGQRYLLRMAVSLFVNRTQKYDVVFLLDEPELHLHPEALINLYDQIRAEFPSSQIWVGTHSIALIAHIEQKYSSDHSIFYFENGKVRVFRSDTAPLIRGLVGGDENRNAYFQLLIEPDFYAANKFAIQCLLPPDVIAASPQKEDEQANYLYQILAGKTVIDYGAGRGRLIAGIQYWLQKAGSSLAETVGSYRAFDIKDKDGSENRFKQECVRVMADNGLSPENYFDEIEELRKAEPKTDYVFLVNVFHEIIPANIPDIPVCDDDWLSFLNKVQSLLKDDGHLIIIEQKEITVGEESHAFGFIVLTEKAAKALFGDDIEICPSDQDGKCIAIKIPCALLTIDHDKVKRCLQSLLEESLSEIKAIHGDNTGNDTFRQGLKLAFWEHQHTNAELAQNTLNDYVGGSVNV